MPVSSIVTRASPPRGGTTWNERPSRTACSGGLEQQPHARRVHERELAQVEQHRAGVLGQRLLQRAGAAQVQLAPQGEPGPAGLGGHGEIEVEVSHAVLPAYRARCARRLYGDALGSEQVTVSSAQVLPGGFELPLEPRLPRIGAVDQVALEERAAALAKRSIKEGASSGRWSWPCG